MRRFRLSTLMLLVVIAALCVGLVVEQRRAARREAELQARLAQSWPVFLKSKQQADIKAMIEARHYRYRAELAKRGEADDLQLLKPRNRREIEGE
jgi:hypothetical protein